MKQIFSIVTISLLSLLIANDISGVSFFKYSVNDFGTDQISRGFELNRVYLTYKNSISDKVSYKFQADMQNNGEAYYMYIKNAKVDLLCKSNTMVTIGLQGMNIFNIQEKNWGNRFIAKSAMDEYTWSSSADLGIGLSQSFNNFSGSLLFTNGEGYKSEATDSNEKISIQVMYGENRLDKNDGFNVGGIFSILKYDEVVAVEDNLSTIHEDETIEASNGGTSTVMGLFVGYSGFGLRLGFEYYMGKDLNLDDYESSSSLMSVYLNYKLPFNIPIAKDLSIYGRFDTLAKDNNVKDYENTMLAGLIFKCTDGVTISPNVTQTYIGTETETGLNLSFFTKF